MHLSPTFRFNEFNACNRTVHDCNACTRTVMLSSVTRVASTRLDGPNRLCGARLVVAARMDASNFTVRCRPRWRLVALLDRNGDRRLPEQDAFMVFQHWWQSTVYPRQCSLYYKLLMCSSPEEPLGSGG
jgi:hypothetical protein